MRKRNAAIVLTVLAILAAVIVREWQDDSVEPVSVVSGEAVPRELSAVHPKVPGARPDGVLESAIVQTPPGPLVDRSKMNAPPTAAVQSTKPLAIAPQPLVSDREHDDREGTAESPGDPLAQPENPTEQFMHSRRGDGQHSE